MTTEPATFDVVVAGSGAAGMTAALTAAELGLSVVVIEKAGAFGGSTARSGGGIWAPGNAVLQAAADSKVAGLKAVGLGCRAAGERPLPRPAA
jgi:3-oxosteroid 1-dehydrogenase